MGSLAGDVDGSKSASFVFRSPERSIDRVAQPASLSALLSQDARFCVTQLRGGAEDTERSCSQRTEGPSLPRYCTLL